MRITFLSPSFDHSGGQRVIATYADRLARRGHEVVVAAPPAPRPTLREIVRGNGLSRLTPGSRRPLCHFEGNAARIRFLPTHRPVRFSDAPRTEVVVATWWETAEWADRNFPADMPKLYLIQHYEPKFPVVPEERAEATWRLPFRKLVVSQWLADIARDQFDDHDWVLIPNSVDTDQFHAPPRGKQKTPTVGIIESPVPWKGSDVALRAVEACRRTIPDLRLVAFGSSPAHHALPPGTHYVESPPQDRIRDLYAMCDVWLSSSTSEGFGLPPLEAMACRCPVVTTRVGAMPELVREGVNGHLADVGDVETLARRLVDVLSKDERGWREMSDAAHATATGYTWDDATDLFEAAVKDEAAARRRPPSRIS